MRTRPGDFSQRMIQIDVLRGVAILLVLGVHQVLSPRQAGRLELPASMLGRIGWTGVDLFFVLSGFLVGGLLMHEIRQRGKLDIRRFLIRRAFKIWPSYYLYLVAIVGLWAWQYGSRFGHPLRLITPNLVHLQNYALLSNPPIAKHTWSLAVEEHFYLLLPLLLLLLGRSGTRGLKAIPWIAVGVGLTCLCLRLQHYSRPFDPLKQQYPTHLRIDSLFLGVLLAYWRHFCPDLFDALARQRRLLLVSGMLLVLPMAYLLLKQPFVHTVGYTMLSLGYACLLVLFVSTRPGEGTLGKWLESRTAQGLAYIGTFSYSIYIWHLDFVMHPIQKMCFDGWLRGLPPTVRWPVVMGVYWVAAIGLGIVMAKVIERPALALRNRLFPARVAAPGNDENESGSMRQEVEKGLTGAEAPAET